jgi:hypothetical protein
MLKSIETSVVLKRLDPDFNKEDYFEFKVIALVNCEVVAGVTVVEVMDIKVFSPLTAETETLEGLDAKRALIAVNNAVREKYHVNPK